MKAVAIVTTENLNLSRIFMVSHLLSAKVYPEQRLNPGFGIQNRKRDPFPWIEGPFTRANKYKDYVNIFWGTKFCVPQMKVWLE